MVIPSIPLWLAFAIGLPIGILGYFGQAYLVGRRGRRRVQAAATGATSGAIAAGPEPRKVWGPSTASSATSTSRPPRAKRGATPPVAEPASAEVAAVLASVADAPAEVPAATPARAETKMARSAAKAAPASAPAPAPAPAPPTQVAAALEGIPPDIAPANVRSARYGKAAPRTAPPPVAPPPSTDEIVPVDTAALAERRQLAATLAQLRRREAVLEDALDVIVAFVDAEPRRAKARVCAKSLDAIMPKTRRAATLRAFVSDADTAKSPSDLQDQAEDLGVELATELKEVKTQLLSIPG